MYSLFVIIDCVIGNDKQCNVTILYIIMHKYNIANKQLVLREFLSSRNFLFLPLWRIKMNETLLYIHIYILKLMKDK